MQLYGSYTSPFVRHCRIALLQTRLDCEFIETDHSTSAQRSPTKKVPFLIDGDLTLTDSLSILKHLRESSGQSFFDDVREYDLFCLINTSLDASVNVFMLERDGIDAERSPYLKRQKARIDSTLIELNRLTLPGQAPYGDMALRLACYLAWGLYRQRFSLESYGNLSHFLQSIDHYEPFAQTAPPRL